MGALRRNIILIIVAVAIGIPVVLISLAVISTVIQQELNIDNPLKVCINERETSYRIQATLELIIDNQPANIPARVGFEEGGCQRSLYTLTNDGTIHAEWEEEYPFEIGHFLWVWDFPLKNMDQSKSKIYVNGEESDHFINHPLKDGYHYKAVFATKASG